MPHRIAGRKLGRKHDHRLAMLGNLAVYKRGKVDWDPVSLKPLNDPSLAKIVHPEYRDGYDV